MRRPHPTAELRLYVESRVAIVARATALLRTAVGDEGVPPHDVERACDDATTAAREALAELRRWQTDVLPDSNDPADGVQHAFLLKSLRDAISAHTIAERALADAVRSTGIRRLRLALGADATVDDAAIRFDAGYTVGDAILHGGVSDEARVAYDDAREHALEVAALSRSILEVSALFANLTILVAEQGDALDRISDHVGVAHANVVRGTKDIAAAAQLQRRVRKRRCCLAVLVLVLIVLVAGVIAGIGGKGWL